MTRELELVVTTEIAAAADAVISSLQQAFNDHDAVAISEHFAEEAAWATVMGKELAGRAEIADFGRSVMERLASSYARYDITRLVVLAPYVVAIRTLQRPVDESGLETDASRAAGLYVIAHRDGGWKIVAGQITFIVDTA
jgi:uncharacterized protein (TIGR02246 family)